MGDPVLAAALGYANRGWAVFPCHPGAKTPLTRHGCKDATTDADQIRAWWREHPHANIAVATGAISGIAVLDVDVKNGVDGEASLRMVLNGHETLPRTLEAQTPTGGRHLFFALTPDAEVLSRAGKLGPGLDTRGNGGYVLVAPSRFNGRTYEWAIEAEPAPVPTFMVEKSKPERGRPRNDDPMRQRYGIEEVREMLAVIPADDREMWRAVGIILGREFVCSDQAWDMYVEWAAKWDGEKCRNHEEIMREAFYDISQKSAERELTMATIVRAAMEHGYRPRGGAVPREAFLYFGPGNNFVYRPTGAHWVAEAVNAAVVRGDGPRPAEWLRLNALATSMTKDPSVEGDFVKGFDAREGELILRKGAALYNAYRPPTILRGDASAAGPFIQHVRRVFPRPGDADQFLDYMAHRVQKPGEKPRFALLIAGEQGVGKDTAIEFCIPAIGAWNVANIEPFALDASFNEYAAAVLVRISEAANLHEMTKWAFNERMKTLVAGTPDFTTINPKYGTKYCVRLHCGVILTTNHALTGLYIPADDRRYDVIEAATKEELGLADAADHRAYFERLWIWYNQSGVSHVAAFLAERDLSRFSASNGQRKTEAHRAIVAVGMTGDAWLLDALDTLGCPRVVSGDALRDCLMHLDSSLTREKVSARIGPAMVRAGYRQHRNPNHEDGRWPSPNGRRSMMWARKELTFEEAEVVRREAA